MELKANSKGLPYALAECSCPDIQEWLNVSDVVMLPIGSMEQHGKHLPMSTDCIAAMLACTGAAEMADVPYSPVMWFGYSPNHMWPVGQGWGTITLKFDTLVKVLHDISRSLIHLGFNKIVIVTGHTYNLGVLDVATRLVKYETNAFMSIFRADSHGPVERAPMLKALLENPPTEHPGWHGSEIETSAVLAHNPKLVRLEKADKHEPHPAPFFSADKFDATAGREVTFHGSKGDFPIWIPVDYYPELAEHGSIGNPLRATAEKGKKIYDIIAMTLAEYLAEVKKAPVNVTNREFVNRVID